MKFSYRIFDFSAGFLFLLCVRALCSYENSKQIDSLIQRYQPKVTLEVGMKDLIAPFRHLKGKVDFVYLNTCRDCVSVFRNLDEWHSLVSAQGILAGDDWGNPKVMRGVQEFAREENLTVHTIQELWYCTPALKPHPIQFSIPEVKIVREIPPKDRDFAFIHPEDRSTYIYESEEEYYKDYQRSYFAVTRKKGGWDCLRHYEILANGCIPYFINLHECDENTMHFLPKELIKQAMSLEGVSYMAIDHEKFKPEKYYEILEKLLAHTRAYLTTRQIAKYLLDTLHYSGEGKVLYLSKDPSSDYLRDLSLIGLKELLQEKVVDYPKIPHIYKSYSGDISALYGKGMTYTRIVEDGPMDRENIEQRVKNREFELIIYGSIHRGRLFYDVVLSNYDSSQIAYLCGEDLHNCQYVHLNNFFLRDFELYGSYNPVIPVYD